jgi:hypothetical protein
MRNANGQFAAGNPGRPKGKRAPPEYAASPAKRGADRWYRHRRWQAFLGAVRDARNPDPAVSTPAVVLIAECVRRAGRKLAPERIAAARLERGAELALFDGPAPVQRRPRLPLPDLGEG